MLIASERKLYIVNKPVQYPVIGTMHVLITTGALDPIELGLEFTSTK